MIILPQVHYLRSCFELDTELTQAINDVEYMVDSDHATKYFLHKVPPMIHPVLRRLMRPYTLRSSKNFRLK